MIIIKNGDLLKASEDILVHQVNVAGIMGGGVAKQIAEKYPITEKEYTEYCKSAKFKYSNLKGQVLLRKEKGKYIANLFSQDKFNTDYESMVKGFERIKSYAIKNNLKIAMPYKIGCGIANGDWELVLDIIIKVFKDYEVTLYFLKCDKNNKK